MPASTNSTSSTSPTATPTSRARARAAEVATFVEPDDDDDTDEEAVAERERAEEKKAPALSKADPILKLDPKEWPTVKKQYDPTVAYEIDGPLGAIGVVRPTADERIRIERLFAVEQGGMELTVSGRNLSWMKITLGVVTRRPGYGPNKARNYDWGAVVDTEDIAHYYDGWEAWDKSFRAGKEEAD
jgi:hypothetical protein